MGFGQMIITYESCGVGMGDAQLFKQITVAAVFSLEPWLEV